MIEWDKEFPVSTVLTRADLRGVGFSDEVIATLTDEDMALIASKLEDTYRENQFFIDVEIMVEYVLENKGKSTE